MAENNLMGDIMTDKIKQIYDKHPITPEDLHYTDFSGHLEFKEVVAKLLQKYVFNITDPVEPSQLIVFNGAGAIIEQTVSALCDPGEAIIIPAPMYLAFERDVVKRFGCVLIPAPMPYNPKTNEFVLDMNVIKQTLQDTRNQGINVKCFLLCTPSNPLGGVHTKQEMKELIQFCSQEQLHLISDEVYALSVFDNSKEGFVSAAKIMFEDLHNEGIDYRHVHIVYSMSKDFALNGLRVGILYSRNEQLVAALKSVAAFQGVSRHTQVLLARLLEDHDFVEKYIAENKKRLAESYEYIVSLMESHNINFIRARAGVLLWIDLGKFIKVKLNKKEITSDDEQEFFYRMMHEAKIYIPCGVFFKCQHAPGWFRICFTASSPEILKLTFNQLFVWLDN